MTWNFQHVDAALRGVLFPQLVEQYAKTKTLVTGGVHFAERDGKHVMIFRKNLNIAREDLVELLRGESIRLRATAFCFFAHARLHIDNVETETLAVVLECMPQHMFYHAPIHNGQVGAWVATAEPNIASPYCA